MRLPKLFFPAVTSLFLFTGCESVIAVGDPGIDPLYPDVSYQDLVSKVAVKRTELGTTYKNATESQKDSIVDAAGDYLFDVIVNDFFSQWDGTEWDFNGTTRTPRKGKIACGYFITTVLYDAGFDIPRVNWAQQASEYFITRLSTDIKRFSNKPVADVKSYIQGKEDGLYIVGLDNHTGFIYKKGSVIRFVHASYYDPKIGVQSEELDSDNPLNRSAYRILGKILGDTMIRKWLTNEKWQ